MIRPKSTSRLGARALWIVGAIAVIALVAGAWWVTSTRSAPAPWARLGTADVHALSFDPVDADRLLFGHHDGLLASADGGRTWQATSLTGSDAMNLGRLTSERLQIAGHEVYLESVDGGVSWNPVENDLPGLDLHSFVADPANGDRAWTFAVGYGLFRTENAGRNWELLDPNNWGALTSYVREGQTVLVAISPGGLMRSRDGGSSWEPIAYPGARLAAMTAAPDGSAIYAATASGVRISTDEGQTWGDTGFTGQALALAVSTSDANLIAVVDDETLFYRSFDGGETWPDPDEYP